MSMGLVKNVPPDAGELEVARSGALEGALRGQTARSFTSSFGSYDRSRMRAVERLFTALP